MCPGRKLTPVTLPRGEKARKWEGYLAQQPLGPTARRLGWDAGYLDTGRIFGPVPYSGRSPHALNPYSAIAHCAIVHMDTSSEVREVEVSGVELSGIKFS